MMGGAQNLVRKPTTTALHNARQGQAHARPFCVFTRTFRFMQAMRDTPKQKVTVSGERGSFFFFH